MRPFFHLLGLRGGLVEPGVFQARERLRRFGSKTVSTKNGLSIVAVIGFSPCVMNCRKFGRTGVGNDRQPFEDLWTLAEI
jgi:hypothetical protein